MDDQIAKAQEQAQSRKDILDKVEKWKHASEEEIWLNEYERVIQFMHNLSFYLMFALVYSFNLFSWKLGNCPVCNLLGSVHLY